MNSHNGSGAEPAHIPATPGLGPDRLQRLRETGGPLGQVGLGCAWGYDESPPSQTDVDELVRVAVDNGVGLYDTADSYGPFISEELLGKALGHRRGEIVLATKGGYPVDAQSGRYAANGDPDFLSASCEASLRRLGTDYIDLYYLHRADPAVPIETSWLALSHLVEQGKVRGLGVCEVDVETLTRLEAIHPVTAVQSELSLWTRDPLLNVIPWCQSTGTAFVGFAPLGRGFLAGTVKASQQFHKRDVRNWSPRFQPEARVANQLIVDDLVAVGRRHGSTPAQIALAWLITQDRAIYAIPGTRRTKYLLENVEASRIVLSDADLALLNEVPAAEGARY